MNHFDYLQKHIPDLVERRILDVGSGKGAFLIAAATKGARAEGVEYSQENVSQTHRRAEGAGVLVSVTVGNAESLPYADASFDFVNVSEVLEHVADPARVVREVARVLVPGGLAYLSIPNRYGLRDPHYLVWGINWIPRSLAKRLLRVCGLDKGDLTAGRQSLGDMHYLTLSAFTALLAKHGLVFVDSREEWVRKQWFAFLALPLFYVYAFCILATFHGIARRL